MKFTATLELGGKTATGIEKRHVLSIEGARTGETRDRRIAKAIEELTKGS